MEFETTRFGKITFEADSLITFTQPIIGFHQHRRFVHLPGPKNSLVSWLQSVEQGDLAFLIMNPRDVEPEYNVPVNSHDLTELGADTVEQIELYTLVVVPPNPAEIRTNLRAPILYFPGSRLAKQVVLDRSDYPIQYYLAQARQRAEARQEAKPC